MKRRVFSVTDELHIFPAAAPWAYVPILKDKVPDVKPGGWGSIPVDVTVGKTTWRTSLFPMKKDNYFVPIKKQVREKESLKVGSKITVKYIAI